MSKTIGDVFHKLIPDVRGWLAISGVGQVTLALLLLAYVPIPTANHDLFVVIISQVIGAGFLMIMQFFFGSSEGAKKGAERLNDMATKAVDAATTSGPKP